MKNKCIEHIFRMYDYKTQTCEDCHLNERIRKEICPLYSRQTKPRNKALCESLFCDYNTIDGDERYKTADTFYVEPIAMQELTDLEQRVAFGNMQLDEIDYNGGGLRI